MTAEQALQEALRQLGGKKQIDRDRFFDVLAGALDSSGIKRKSDEAHQFRAALEAAMGQGGSKVKKRGLLDKAFSLDTTLQKTLPIVLSATGVGAPIAAGAAAAGSLATGEGVGGALKNAATTYGAGKAIGALKGAAAGKSASTFVPATEEAMVTGASGGAGATGLLDKAKGIGGRALEFLGGGDKGSGLLKLGALGLGAADLVDKRNQGKATAEFEQGRLEAVKAMLADAEAQQEKRRKRGDAARGRRDAFLDGPADIFSGHLAGGGR